LVNLTADAKSTRDALEKVADSELKSSFAAQHALDNFEELDDQQQNNLVSALMYAAGNQVVESSLDDVEDEAEDASNELEDTAQDLATGALFAQFFSGELGSLSLNLGAVNVALRNMSKQIPMLITTLGTLGSVIGGLASSAVAAGAGIGGIFAAGAIAQAKQFKEEVAGITELSGGFEAIRANAMDMFAEAASPLLEAQGVIEFFTSSLEAMAQEVNLVAQTIRNMMGIFTDFASETGEILSSGFNDFVEDMAFSFLLLQDELKSTIKFFAEGIPAAIRFMSKVTENVGTELGAFVNEFIKFAAQLIKLGSSIQAGILPVLTELLEVGTEFVKMLNDIGSENIAAIASISGMILVFTKLAGTLNALIVLGSKVAGSLAGIGSSMISAKGATSTFVVGILGLAKAIKDALLESDALSTLLSTLSEKFGGVGRNVGLFAGGLRATAGAMKSALIAGGPLKALLTGLGGLVSALSTVMPFLAFTIESMAISFAAAAKSGGIWAGTFAAINTLAKAVAIKLGILTTLTNIYGVASLLAAGNITLFQAAAWGLTGAMAALKAVMSGVVVPLLAMAAIGGLVVGLLTNADKAAGGLSDTLSKFISVLKAIGSYLISLFVPIWNDLVTIIEFVLTLLNPLIGLLTGGKSGLRGLTQIFIDFFKVVAYVFRGIFDFVAGIASGITDILEYLNFKRANLSDAKITESQAEEAVGDAANKASDMVPGSGNNQYNFNQNNVSQNYGDVNADPEEKEQMKRLVKEAMMEANTYRRQDDGFSG
jgi:hypothetical protein